ncbi:MAG: proline/glycine betaine ABC transporter permease [Dehalococcoidales bacterium]|nr:proline/glycine betaine ABC transporter permease [Dehalococcoidales bacterium]
MEFPEWINLPLAGWIDTIMDWVLVNWGFIFDAIGDGILQVLLYIEKFLLWLPWFVVILAVGVLAWRVMRSWIAGLIMMAFLVLIGSFGSTGLTPYWDLTMMTLAVIIAAGIISLAIGIPTGILMASSNRFESIIRPFLDAMQTMPSFVYLIPALMLFGLGKVPAVFATIIYAVPPVIRLTNVGIRQVAPSVVEAAQAFGSSKRQVLFEVQIPLAIPSIMVGINQTTMMALAMVVIASMIGARGLGLEVLLAINRIEIGRGFEAGLSIVLLAIIIDRITNAMAAKQQYDLSH